MRAEPLLFAVRQGSGGDHLTHSQNKVSGLTELLQILVSPDVPSPAIAGTTIPDGGGSR
jgi:hypothetical protein